MKNNWDFNDFEAIKEIKHKYYALIIGYFLLVVSICILFKFDFYVYENYSLFKNSDHFSVLVKCDNIKLLEKNTIIYIDQQKYNYKILSIDSNYTEINGTFFQTIELEINNYHTDAIITKSVIFKERGTLFQKFIKFIKGGIK